MMNIKHAIYENLTPQQRIIASIEALARDDDAEHERLIKTCPKKTYRQNDAEYADQMEALLGLAMAIECDLRGCALAYFIALRLDHEAMHQCLQTIADIRAAWENILSGIGIDPEIMKKAGPPSSPVLEWIGGMLPDPDPENVEKISLEIYECLSNQSRMSWGLIRESMVASTYNKNQDKEILLDERGLPIHHTHSDSDSRSFLYRRFFHCQLAV